MPPSRFVIPSKCARSGTVPATYLGMKTWMLTGVIWAVLIMGGEYYLTGMNNDKQDNAAGRVAGYGVGACTVIGLLRRGLG